MQLLSDINNKPAIRLSVLLSLIFFVAVFTSSCGSSAVRQIQLVYNDSRATAVVLPDRLFSEISPDLYKDLKLRLYENDQYLLGDLSVETGHFVFTPVVPFTPGETYEILFAENVLDSFSVELPDSVPVPVLTRIYPEKDTVPENLLKMYLSFSEPMRQGEALRHIKLFNEAGDSLPGTFLELQPELWDSTRSVLTLWLDPGRIKRDLIPNRALGNPLQKGKTYTLQISAFWRSAEGQALGRTTIKKFVVAERDNESPDPDR